MRFGKIALLALLSAPLTSLAQPPGGPPRMLDIDRLTILLDLDAYQQSEVERILQAQREAMRSEFQARDGERPSREEMMAAREIARAETITQLRSVLTESQIEKFEVLTERPPRDGRRRPPAAE